MNHLQRSISETCDHCGAPPMTTCSAWNEGLVLEKRPLPELAPHQCPFCEHTLEPIPEGSAKVGDFILCGACHAALRYTDGMALREMTVDEAIEFPNIAQLFGVRRHETAAERPAQ